MALNPSVVWRMRVGGDDLNGGAFDPAVSGAGTDYSQQDAAQVSSTTGVCTSASTTFTDVLGSFTAAMVGNMLAISAGTNALKQHFMIVARTNSTTITLDRTPTDGGAITACTYKIGGAKATLSAFSNSGGGTPPTVTQTDGLAAGHIVYIRGSGSQNPTSNDYSESSYLTFANGDTTNGTIQFIGENGRPQIGTSGLLVYTPSLLFFSGLCFEADGIDSDYLGIIGGGFRGNRAFNCRFDQNGNDISAINGVVTCVNCQLVNTGSTATGSFPALNLANFGNGAHGCRIDKWRGGGVYLGARTFLSSTLITDCNTFGVYAVSGDDYDQLSILQNTIHNCDKNIVLANPAAGACVIKGNLLTGAATSGLEVGSGSTALNDRLAVVRGYNAFFGNTDDVVNISKSPSDVTLTDDPYTDSAGGDFTLNADAGGGADCRAGSLPGQL